MLLERPLKRSKVPATAHKQDERKTEECEGDPLAKVALSPRKQALGISPWASGLRIVN